MGNPSGLKGLKWIMILMLEEQKQVREVAPKVLKYWRLRTSLLCIENCYLARNKLLLCSLKQNKFVV